MLLICITLRQSTAYVPLTLVTAYVPLTLVTAYVPLTLVTAYVLATLVTAYVLGDAGHSARIDDAGGTRVAGELTTACRHTVEAAVSCGPYSISCRPYCVAIAGSHLNSEVNQHKARLVLGRQLPWNALGC